jgi:hypothetical protein
MSNANANPLKFNYALGNQGNVVTTVSGDNRDIANIVVNNVNTPVYTTTLNSIQLKATTDQDIVLGSLTILKGARFSLTIPSSTQTGWVMLNCSIKSGDNDPTPFSAMIASWTLSSLTGTDY